MSFERQIGEALATLSDYAETCEGLLVQISEKLEDADGTEYYNIMLIPRSNHDMRVSRVEDGVEVKYSYVHHEHDHHGPHPFYEWDDLFDFDSWEDADWCYGDDDECADNNYCDCC